MRPLCVALLFALPLAAADATPYLPAETDAVVTVQVRQVADSELGKKVGGDLLRTLLTSFKPAESAVQATGLDLLKDFDVVTVGMDIDKLDAPKPFALMEGKFDVAKVEASLAEYAKANPMKLVAVKVQGKPAYKIVTADAADTMYAAILDGTKIAVAGSEDDLAGAFAAAAGGRKPAIAKELADLLATAKSPAPIFARAWVKDKLNDLNLGSDKMNARVRSITWATASVVVTKDVAVHLTVDAPNELTAQQLSDLFGGALGILRLQMMAAAEDQPELKPIVELLKTTKSAASGRNVVITASVRGETIAKAVEPKEKIEKK